MITGPANAHHQARAALLAWTRGIDAASQSQTGQLNAMSGKPQEPAGSNWFTDYVEGVQERWPKFLDHVGETANEVGEGIQDYFEGVGERWDQLVGGEDRSAGMS
jgi:hypothetical protein